jgi:hypothetical protein
MQEFSKQTFIEFIENNMQKIKTTIINVVYFNSKYDFTNLFEDLNLKQFNLFFQLEFIDYYEKLKLFLINHLESISKEDKEFILSFYK